MTNEQRIVFRNKNLDLKKLTLEIVNQFSAEGYTSQWAKTDLGYWIQLAKQSLLRTITAGDRVFHILVSGTPNDFTVRVGVGKMVKDVAVTAVEGILLSGWFLAVNIPNMLWTQHVEGNVINKIKQIVAAS